ncbi:MAG TPA: ABC transporter permease [Candidatus Limnocylindria bacterium]|jgi:ABC-type dipeptide/oligopeptide/nickel transport system permease subunit
MAEARVAGIGEVAVPAHRSRGFWGDTVRRLLRTPAGVIGLVIVVAMILIGFVGPALLPYTYYEQDLDAVIAYGGPIPPGVSANHPLGTDVLGRDLLARTVDGAQVSLTVAFVAQIVVLAIGVPVGLLAGWRGGWMETGLMRFTDIIGTFPDLLFIIMIQAAIVDTPFFTLVNGLLATFIAIGLISWVGTARLVRGQTLSLKEREDIEAARAVGVPGNRIVRRHILPQAMGPIAIAISLGIPMAILAESTLSFLGLGVQIPRASWGSLIDIGIDNIQLAPWLLFPPMIALGVTLIGFTLLGDGLRDALDPRASRWR